MMIEKILKKEDFSREVELLVADGHSGIEAVLMLAEKKNIEIETVPRLLTQTVKEILQVEAEDLNMLKKKRTRLPF